MKHVLRLLGLSALVALLLCSVAIAEQGFDMADYVQEITLSEDDPNYWHDLCRAEIYNMRVLRNVPTAFEAEGFDAYFKNYNSLLSCNPDNLTEKKTKVVMKSLNARRGLVQVKNIADCIWPIWGDSMPSLKDPAKLTYKLNDYDEPDFKPFILHYMLEDQASVKGNIIVVAGGGFSRRANEGEGYPVAERFNELGYNCFVLQRRVAPYANEDTFMDLQRAIRYLRYHAEEYGIGAMDCLAAMGFSGGSATVLGCVKNLYGDVQPTIYDASYTPDAIDAMSADLDAICSQYGPNAEYEAEYRGLVTDNPNLPDMFIAAGDMDTASDQLLWLAQSVKGKTRLECHIFADAEHAYRLGVATNNSPAWVAMFDTFLMNMEH